MLVVLPAEEYFLHTLTVILQKQVDHLLLSASVDEREVFLIMLFDLQLHLRSCLLLRAAPRHSLHD
jgi:hypothetical protein